MSFETALLQNLTNYPLSQSSNETSSNSDSTQISVSDPEFIPMVIGLAICIIGIGLANFANYSENRLDNINQTRPLLSDKKDYSQLLSSNMWHKAKQTCMGAGCVGTLIMGVSAGVGMIRRLT